MFAGSAPSLVVTSELVGVVSELSEMLKAL